MKESLEGRPFAQRLVQQVLFAIDAIKRKKVPGLEHDYQISQRIGSAKQTISNWRTGQRAPTIDQVGMLINEFDIDPKFLFKFEGSPWGEADLIVRLLDVEERVKVLEKKTGIKKR